MNDCLMVVFNLSWSEFESAYLYDVVIKQQPEAVALDDGDVVSAVGTTAAWRQTGGKTRGRRYENNTWEALHARLMEFELASYFWSDASEKKHEIIVLKTSFLRVKSFSFWGILSEVEVWKRSF